MTTSTKRKTAEELLAEAQARVEELQAKAQAKTDKRIAELVDRRTRHVENIDVRVAAVEAIDTELKELGYEWPDSEQLVLPEVEVITLKDVSA